jgi:hypothetical protein
MNANLSPQAKASIGSPAIRERSTTPIGTEPPASAQLPATTNMNTADLMKNLTSLGLLGSMAALQPPKEQNKNLPSNNLPIVAFGPFRLDSKDIQM